MLNAPKRVIGLSVVVLAAAGLAACSSSKSTSAAGGGNGSSPVYGGTLKIVASSGPAHIDTVPAYFTGDYELERVYARQLITYPTVGNYNSTSDPGWTAAITPVPDVATQVPTAADGGITNGGKTYTFHLKPGVDWNTTPARQVTAQDFLREFKAFCNPVSPVGNQAYYTSTIAGMASYCAKETTFFAKKGQAQTAAAIAGFQDANNISGIVTPDSATIQFTLLQPSSDFIYMLAMPFASARPAEYDQYVPASLGLNTHTISDGPYQISLYQPGKQLQFVKNLAWKQSTDAVRHQYVNNIVMVDGVSSAQTQLSDMQAGTEDVTDDTALNPPSIPGLIAAHSAQFKIWPWSSTNPYIVFNLRSPDSNKAMANLLVRQAIEYGVNKVAVQKANGGPEVGPILNTVIPPGNVGYQDYNLYPDNNGQGDPAKCKSTLAQAGFPNGISLIYAYIADSVNTRIFQAVQGGLASCGVTVQGKPIPVASFFTDMGNAPESNKANQWDMAQVGWIPDWFGNNGRTIIQALFASGECVVNTSNDGCYSNPSVDSDITQAESASSLDAAGTFWHAADVQIMKDAAIVPLMDQGFPSYTSARVRGPGIATGPFAPNIGEVDITNLWLANG